MKQQELAGEQKELTFSKETFDKNKAIFHQITTTVLFSFWYVCVFYWSRL
jgi:hypothetical protein